MSMRATGGGRIENSGQTVIGAGYGPVRTEQYAGRGGTISNSPQTVDNRTAEQKVRSQAMPILSQSGSNQSLTGVYDSVQVSGMNHNVYLICLGEIQISGMNHTGTVFIPENARTSPSISGTANSVRIVRKSWSELEQIARGQNW